MKITTAILEPVTQLGIWPASRDLLFVCIRHHAMFLRFVPT